jgi:hypothetical protein
MPRKAGRRDNPESREQRALATWLAEQFERPGTLDRFWSKVERGDGCWTWTAATNGRYGLFCVSRRGGPFNRRQYAHRCAYTLSHGPLNVGMYVCHRCDNPLCVRPDHLFAGSPADNHWDCRAKGRWVHVPHIGEAHGRALVTVADVRRMRRLHTSGTRISAISVQFGVSETQAHRIVKRQSWRHVE